MTDLDTRIRAAVTELVEAAPEPKPLPNHRARPQRSNRWVAIAAAVVLLGGGVAAVFASRTDEPDTLQSGRIATTAAPTPATTSPTTSPATSPTSTPAPVPGFSFGPDDVVATDLDGTLWWYPGLLGDAPGERVLLLDPADGAAHDLMGLADGSLLIDLAGDAGQRAVTLSSPGARAVDSPWTGLSVSPDGSRAVSCTNGVAVITEFAIRSQGELLADNEVSCDVEWSADSASYFWIAYDAPLSWLRRASASEPMWFNQVLEFYSELPQLLGRDPGGNLVLRVFSKEQRTYLRTVDPDTMTLIDGVWDVEEGASLTSWDLAPDGTQALRVDDGTLSTVDLTGNRRTLLTDTARAWFVPVVDVELPDMADFDDAQPASMGDDGVFTVDTPPIPAGALAIGPEDLIAVRADGDLWWYPDVLAEDPGEPIRLADLPEDVAGQPRFIVNRVAGVVDGTLVLSTTRQATCENTIALTAPEAAPIGVGCGDIASFDDAGSRLAIATPSTLSVLQRGGGLEELALDVKDGLTADVAWTRPSDALVVVRHGQEATTLELRSPARPFDVVTATTLNLEPFSTTAEHASIIGNGPDGEIVIALWRDRTLSLRSFDPISLAQIPGVWDRDLTDIVDYLSLSPDGQRFVWTAAGSLQVEEVGRAPQPVLEGISRAWFVPVFETTAG